MDGIGALGGSIKFVTKDADDLLRGDEQFGALLKGTYQSNSEGYKTSANLFGRFNDSFSALAVISKLDNDNYSDGDGTELLGTESEQDYGYLKLVGEFIPDLTTVLSFESRNDKGLYAQRPQWEPSDWNPLFPLESDRETVKLSVDYSPIDNEFIDLSFVIYNTDNAIEQNGRWGPFRGGVVNQGFDLRNTSTLGDHKITYGVEYREDESFLDSLDGAYDNQSEEGEILAFYLQDKFQISEQLTLSAGLRHDNYELKGKRAVGASSYLDTPYYVFEEISNPTFEDSDTSANANLTYQVNDAVSVYAGYAQAFRGVIAGEAFTLDVYTNHADLKPETAENVEIGIKFQDDAFDVTFELFQSEIKDAITKKDYLGVVDTVLATVTDPAQLPDLLGRKSIVENIGDLETSGFSVTGYYTLEAFRFGLNYISTDTEVTSYDGETLPLNGYDHGTLGTSIGDSLTGSVAYTLNDDVELGYNVRNVQELSDFKVSAGSIDKPGYTVHDAYAQWFANEDLTVTLTVKNLLDKQYLDHATNADFGSLDGWEGVAGQAEAGRDVRLSASYQF